MDTTTLVTIFGVTWSVIGVLFALFWKSTKQIEQEVATMNNIRHTLYGNQETRQPSLVEKVDHLEVELSEIKSDVKLILEKME